MHRHLGYRHHVTACRQEASRHMGLIDPSLASQKGPKNGAMCATEVITESYIFVE